MLGDIDNEWLDYTLNSPEVSQLVFYDENALIGVVGIFLPNTEYNYYTVMEFAVNPIFHKRGYGTKILNYLMNFKEYEKSNIWKAIVAVENKKARSFLKKTDGNLTVLRIISMSKFSLKNNFFTSGLSCLFF
ncbi:hypothetical protein Xmau_00463 [Xenorhabdus mauleonii]|uniref:Acetyltransferase (GNAT) family protein n=1 Tax=Xenorhabdus mauleonii TaxID=351675 RepID=A0A1I3J1Z7_9GAMM|nr:GNAT family N-acetyltransferase [Xenorhabdus mauleonii]PHM46068.1 hypothetical protein Xmau_00463 [Xenorhabdus mauleonii]SFI54153.1 Acetyltransferase (GNAT) family protein [Xenorhabdus mauleonii]